MKDDARRLPPRRDCVRLEDDVALRGIYYFGHLQCRPELKRYHIRLTQLHALISNEMYTTSPTLPFLRLQFSCVHAIFVLHVSSGGMRC